MMRVVSPRALSPRTYEISQVQLEHFDDEVGSAPESQQRFVELIGLETGALHRIRVKPARLCIGVIEAPCDVEDA